MTYSHSSTASWPSPSLIAEHQANNFILLRSKIRRLPLVHQAVLKALLEHLGRVVAHSEKNKMDPKNLAIVFGSVIFGEDEMPKGGDLLSVQTYKVMFFNFDIGQIFTSCESGYPDGGSHHILSSNIRGPGG